MKKNSKTESEAKEVFSFLNRINEFQSILIHHCSEFSMQAKQIIRKYDISKEEFCEKMQISISKYNAFIKGGFSYDLIHAVRLQRLSDEKAIEHQKPNIVSTYKSNWGQKDMTGFKGKGHPTKMKASNNQRKRK